MPLSLTEYTLRSNRHRQNIRKVAGYFRSKNALNPNKGIEITDQELSQNVGFNVPTDFITNYIPYIKKDPNKNIYYFDETKYNEELKKEITQTNKNFTILVTLSIILALVILNIL